VAHTDLAGQGRRRSRQRRKLGSVLPHQPHRPITKGKSIFFGMTNILPTQKDAAPNLRRFTFLRRDTQPLIRQAAQTRLLGQAHDRQQARGRHEVRIIK